MSLLSGLMRAASVCCLHLLLLRLPRQQWEEGCHCCGESDRKQRFLMSRYMYAKEKTGLKLKESPAHTYNCFCYVWNHLSILPKHGSIHSATPQRTCSKRRLVKNVRPFEHQVVRAYRALVFTRNIDVRVDVLSCLTSHSTIPLVACKFLDLIR